MPTEMADSIKQNAHEDESAVAAVRDGDAERYRELVERHERRVFAVAWSRLGDATLAEEVTQEAFIRAYRRLWLLGDGAKFAGWINTIARRVAINFGLRHRRELNKRERWALEHPGTSTEEESAAETDPLHTPETLRQTLAELPAAHRECLVLFYLEGKSGAEAAVALGISESALRVRLHRARAALRERLEDRLAGSLEQLRPTRALVPAIMAGVLASSSAKAATAGGVGATILGTLTKLAPIKWVFAIFPLLFALPVVLVSWLMLRAELANYRDAKGFRVRMFREDNLRRLVWMLVVVAVVFSGFYLMPIGRVGQDNFYLIIAAFCVVTSLMLWRQLVINRSRYFVVMFFLSSGIMTAACLLIGFHVVPVSAFNLFLGAQVLMTTLVYGERPARMDYNLFLRAAEGMLDLSPPKGSLDVGRIQFGKRELLAFGRFLGGRWMADNYRWTAEGLLLRLPSFKFSLWNAMGFFSSWSRRSRLLLAWDGKVSAQLCQQDKKSLLDLHPHSVPKPDELEKQVAVAVETAWQHFRKDNFARAERVLGQVPEAEVFVKSPAQTGFARWQTRIGMVLLALITGLTGLKYFMPPWMDGLKPVSATETEVRSFLGNITTNQNPIISNRQRRYLGDPTTALYFCLALPPTNLFTPAAMRAVHYEVFRAAGLNSQADVSDKLRPFEHAWLLHKAMSSGWFGWDDVGLQPQDATVYLHRLTTNEWQFRLQQRKAWSWVDNQGWEVERIDNSTWNQLRWLREVNCLDLVEREKLNQQIAAVQVLSGTPPGQPPIHDWRAVRGLFFTPNWPALQDTYFSLAALEMLGGLDKIDREACIKGILKRHRGQGYFTSPDSGGFNEYHIDGSARDTFAAFESLRILSALDRVKDLDKWQFRVTSHRSSKPAANGVRTLTWDEVEAWVCQQRLGKILRERNENPYASVRSLLAP